MAAHQFRADEESAAIGPADEEPDQAPGFVAFAGEWHDWVEGFLAHAESGRRRAAGDLAASWSPQARDPEFRKNLRIFGRLVGAASGIYARAVAARSAGDADAREWAGDVLARENELRERVQLPRDRPIMLTVLLARRFQLEQLLIDLGDREYLAGRLAELYDEGEATHATWRRLYGDQLPPLLPGPVTSGPAGWESGGTATPSGGTAAGGTAPGEPVRPGSDDLEATRERMSRLMHVKEAQDQVFRARWQLKRPAAWMVAAVLAVVTIALAAAVAWMVAVDPSPGGRVVVAAAAAGAAGAALGGLFRLRDEIRLGSEVRQFTPFFVGEVVVGAAAGVVVFLVHEAGIIAISGDGPGVAAVAFAVGFSEAAFIGLLTRIVGPAERPESTQAERSSTG